MVKLTLYIFILLTFIACKYEDGPKISLRTKKHRLINSWTIDKVYEDGVDKTDQYKEITDYRINIRKDKSYDITYNIYGSHRFFFEKGSWKFNDDKMEAVFTADIPYWGWDTQPMHWKILRLKEKSLWIRHDISSNRREDVEVHFK